MKKLTFKNKKFLLEEATSSFFQVADFDTDIPGVREESSHLWRNEFREISPQLQLCISMACNLECGYCVFRERNKKNHAKSMKLETAKEAIRMFFETLHKDQKFARIDFGVAGEPFIAEKYHAPLKKYIKKLCIKYKKTVWVGANMSNGLVFPPKKMIKRMGVPMDISIDGDKNDHNMFRKYKNKNGTYDDLIDLIKLAKDRGEGIGACSVITADTLDIAKNFKHIFDLGIRSSIYMKPVNSSYKSSFSLKKETLPHFKRAYNQFIDFLLESNDEDLFNYLKAINPEDFFFRFFYRILNRTILRYRCNCGKSGLYIDWDGKIYPCAHFIGAQGWDMGDVRNGVCESKRIQFMNQTVENRMPCKRCWAKYFCGGGCYYQGWLANGNIEEPDNVKCQLVKHLIKLQAFFISELKNKRRSILEKLDNPYFSGAINSVPPQKRGDFSPRDIGIIGKDEVSLSLGKYELQLSFLKNKIRIRLPKEEYCRISILIDHKVRRRYQWDEACFYKDIAEYEEYIYENKMLKFRKNGAGDGFVSIPFKKYVFSKANLLVDSADGINISVPRNKNELGLNVIIDDGKKINAIVPERFGIIKLNRETKTSRINSQLKNKIIVRGKNKGFLPLWIDNNSSELFGKGSVCISYDSSVC